MNAVAVMLEIDGKILIGPQEDFYSGYQGLPWTYTLPGETPEYAARRRMKELGYDVVIEGLIKTTENFEGGSVTLHYYMVRLAEKSRFKSYYR